MPEETGSTTDGDSPSGETADPTAEGTAATAAQPQRVFVDGRWMTAEELASERSQLMVENAEFRGREAGAMQNPNAAPPVNEPQWASMMRENGTDEQTIQQLVANAGAQTDQAIRGAIHDELGKLSQQASQIQDAQASAKSQFTQQFPDFDEAQMHSYLAGDPATKEGFDGFNKTGKHYQAYDYAWSKRLLGGGKAVSEQGRQHARVPSARGAARMSREESTTHAAGTRPKIPKEVLEAVSYNADEEAITEYMRHRRKGTALDLDAAPPVNISRR